MGSDIIALRGEGTVDAPLIRVVSVLLDYARAPEWVDSLEEVRVVRMTGPLEFVEYNRVGTPPIIMKDRDFVCRGRLSLDLAKQTFMMAIEPTRDPAVPRDDRYVRGELRGFQSGWARSTLEDLREQVAKPDIKVMPQVKTAFEGKPIDLTVKTRPKPR